MAYKVTYEKHAVAFPSKMLASNYGKHIYNLKVASAPMDNGSLVARNDWIEDEVYSYKYSTGVEGIIRKQTENGNWLVEVTKPGDGLLVCQVPLVELESKSIGDGEHIFYNKVGDIVRAYELAVGDLIELSAECFETEVGEVAVKATVASDTDSYKWKVQGA